MFEDMDGGLNNDIAQSLIIWDITRKCPLLSHSSGFKTFRFSVNQCESDIYILRRPCLFQLCIVWGKRPAIFKHSLWMTLFQLSSIVMMPTISLSTTPNWHLHLLVTLLTLFCSFMSSNYWLLLLFMFSS